MIKFMRVSEKLEVLDPRNILGEEWLKFYNHSTCPANVEFKYNIIGDKRMNRFCELGCSVDCMKEYLNLKT